MLVEAVAGEHFAMPCQDVSGIFDTHPVEDLMCRVGHQAIDRPDEPLPGVEQMRQRVLNGAPATGAIRVVNRPVGRAIGREVLPGNGQQLHGLTESARRDRPPHRGQERVAAIDIGDARDQIASRKGPLQWTDPLEAGAERLLDQHVHPGLRQFQGEPQVRRRGSRDHGQIGRVPHGLAEILERPVNGVSLRDRPPELGIDLDERDIHSTGLQEAAQVALAYRPNAYHE